MTYLCFLLLVLAGSLTRLCVDLCLCQGLDECCLVDLRLCEAVCCCCCCSLCWKQCDCEVFPHTAAGDLGVLISSCHCLPFAVPLLVFLPLELPSALKSRWQSLRRCLVTRVCCLGLQPRLVCRCVLCSFSLGLCHTGNCWAVLSVIVLAIILCQVCTKTLGRRLFDTCRCEVVCLEPLLETDHYHVE